jgi:HSP20 family protein
MNLVRWQPRTLVRTPILNGSLEAELDRMFDWALGSERNCAAPGLALDVVQESNRYVVRADLPGLSREDVEITFQDGVLTIRGEKKKEETREEDRVHVRERFHGSFARTIRLPEQVNANGIEASMKDGVLELTLPFVPEAQPRKIEVK